MIKDKVFSVSVAAEADSVVQEGDVSSHNLTTKYFSHYEEMLEYLKQQCLLFTEGE